MSMEGAESAALAGAFEALAGPDRAREMDRLFPLVYAQLRAMAAHQFAGESPGHTLQPTALVHEAWLRLVDQSGPHWSEPRYFFAAAAEAMRRILIEHARRKNRPTHEPWRARVALDVVERAAPAEDADWAEFDGAVGALHGLDHRAAAVVRLRVYGGLTVAQTAEVLGISAATVKREWAYAAAWLRDRLGEGDAP